MKVANFVYHAYPEYSNNWVLKTWMGEVTLGGELVLSVDLGEYRPYNETDALEHLEYIFAKRLQAVLNG
jgi:hypothetical protein